MVWIVLIIIVLLLALLGYGMWKTTRRRRLSGSSARTYQEAFQRVMTIADDHRKILEAETIVDKALTELGYAGTFADKLRKAGPRFSNVQSLWEAHKLRNKIAHEMGMQVNGSEVRSATGAFERGLRDLC